MNDFTLIKMLRLFVTSTSPEITDEELQEVEDKFKISQYFDNDEYEYNDSHIITKNLTERDDAVQHMCCGIGIEDFKLDSGEVIYFAFDYGH